MFKIKKKFPFINISFKGNSRTKPVEKSIKIIRKGKLQKSNDFFILANPVGNKYSATMKCPKCNNFIGLTTNHVKTIDEDGLVTIYPSILCENCLAHFWIRKNLIYHTRS